MTSSLASQPIGIFDSGIGGLTAAKALVKELPHENIIYFGDTAHMPYGDKSTAAIQAYAVKIAHMLLQQQCKLILIACYSATAAAYELIKEYIGSRAVLVNVVDPVILLLKEKYAAHHIGLIGTRQTVNSHIFKRKIDQLNLNTPFSAYATNLLAAAIEEFGDHDIIDSILRVYLAHPQLQMIDTLILACTHYPIIKKRIMKYYESTQQAHIHLIDPSEIVAKAVKNQLEKHQLSNKTGQGKKIFYVSDYTDSFATNASVFFNENVQLEHYPLWD